MDAQARDEKRQQCHLLLGALRGDPSVPQPLFELLGHLASRLDRLECGGDIPPEEAPTRPNRRATPSPFEAVGHILDEAKKKGT